ncbi:uncharacterized protein DSM5745_04385 [Aspergillus mulundensis]|uniref:NmrA-like domain-containing protein n=1 Tax=Aspergillus mulundensis TaxID=1810919 RepID=A0A3D8SCI6_9EURO|nr:Uncharacterized protein DSM5745_04385 [Aspergillus mulundensis]RDW84059.1 Uncharacterized protein DSM5745_04385 [Aspergillus mulundensis]
MSKIITIIGATGIQGGSVVNALLSNPDSNYTLRAITRNPSSPAAVALREKGIEVVRADVHDLPSLISAFAGSHAIFAVTTPFESLPKLGIEKAMAAETEAGINLAKAAAATSTLEHYIWSTLPDSKRISGRSVSVPYYASKRAVDEFIKTNLKGLWAKTTFLWIGCYASNMGVPLYHPSPVYGMDGGRTYVTFINVDPSTKMPLAGDETVNVGLFAKAILEKPQLTLPGKIVSCVVEERAFGDVVETFGRVKGVQARALRIAREDYRALWPVVGDVLDTSMVYFKTVGGKAFSASVEGDDVLTSADLGIEGLVGMEEAFERLPLLG